jgi:predicted DNA-binding transcriptional regulator AlpA
MYELPETGFLRLTDIVGRKASKTRPAKPAIVPVSASTWWAGVKAGRYPQPSRALGPNITAWRVEDIRALLTAAGPKVAA